MPRVNALLLIGVLLLVALFRSSSALASAYGIAVTGTMVVTGMMAFVVIWRMWRWPLYGRRGADRAVPADRPDLSRRQHAQGRRRRLGAAGARRRADGGDVHLAARQPAPVREDPHDWRCRSTTWCASWRGSRRHACRARRCSSPAIPISAPTALLHSLKHYKVLHEKNVILTIETDAHAARRRRRARAASSRSARPSRACCCVSASWRRRTFRKALGHRPQARLAVRHHVDVVLPVPPRAASRPRTPACRAGRTACSSRSPAAPTTPPTTSRFRPGGWSRSAPRLRSRVQSTAVA